MRHGRLSQEPQRRVAEHREQARFNHEDGQQDSPLGFTLQLKRAKRNLGEFYFELRPGIYAASTWCWLRGEGSGHALKKAEPEINERAGPSHQHDHDARSQKEAEQAVIR